jgi:hypothetical protein
MADRVVYGYPPFGVALSLCLPQRALDQAAVLPCGQSQSEIFALNLDQEIKACWDEVDIVWKDRPHDPLAKRESANRSDSD